MMDGRLAVSEVNQLKASATGALQGAGHRPGDMTVNTIFWRCPHLVVGRTHCRHRVAGLRWSRMLGQAANATVRKISRTDVVVALARCQP